jgi:hypothetical protein
MSLKGVLLNSICLPHRRPPPPLDPAQKGPVTLDRAARLRKSQVLDIVDDSYIKVMHNQAFAATPSL